MKKNYIYALLTVSIWSTMAAVALNEQVSFRAIVALIFIVGGILLQNFCDYIRKKKSV